MYGNRVNLHWLEMMPDELLARRPSPSEQCVEFDGDGGVSEVSDDTKVPFARSLDHDNPLTQPRVDQVGIWQRRSLGG